MKQSPFRNWLQEMWMQHKEECYEWHAPLSESNSEEYFRKYKWWLKREYKHWRNLK